MHGQNFLFNQPLAIDRNYLLSLLPSLILGFKNNSFESAGTLEQNAQRRIAASLEDGMSSGADQYPVVFDILGPIVKYTDYNYIGTQTMMRWLSYLDKDPRISGIVFNIDSGGGMVSGTAEFADFIYKMEKPTISWTNDTQCSAAEWIASPCDYKMAGPNALNIGSIGTMMNFQDFTALFEKFGATIYEVYAPQSTEKNLEFRELLNGNAKPYQDSLAQITDTFITTIKTNYQNKITDDGHVFAGKTYNAQEALAIGLVQEIGSLSDALAKF